MTLVIVDKECPKCGKVFNDVYKDEELYCDKCNEITLRIYGGYKKYKEFIPSYFYHFDNEPLWIESPEQFKREAKKRGLHQLGGQGSYYHE